MMDVKDVNRALEWYGQHSAHVDCLMRNEKRSYPMSGSDVARPELWKAAAWRHLFENYLKNQNHQT